MDPYQSAITDRTWSLTFTTSSISSLSRATLYLGNSDFLQRAIDTSRYSWTLMRVAERRPILAKLGHAIAEKDTLFARFRSTLQTSHTHIFSQRLSRRVPNFTLFSSATLDSSPRVLTPDHLCKSAASASLPVLSFRSSRFERFGWV